MNENKEFECQQINLMLEYQNIDKKYTDLLEKVTKSEDAKKYQLAQNERKRALEELVRINTLTEELYKNYDSIMEQYKEVKAQIDELTHVVNDEENSDESLDYCIKQLEKYDAKISEIQDQIDQLVSSLNHKRVEYKAEIECANKAAQLESRAKQACEQLKNANMEEAKTIQQELAQAKASIQDKELFNAYLAAKKRGIKRILVPYYNKEGMCVCSGCGMEVTVNVKSAFEEGAVKVECPNCGRIIYKLD